MLPQNIANIMLRNLSDDIILNEDSLQRQGFFLILLILYDYLAEEVF